MTNVLKFQPYEVQLDILFQEYFDNLKKAELIKLSESSKVVLPKKGGIYVFYEGTEKPIYVGRTKDIRQRIQLHTRDSSKSESASFTFILAKIEYKLIFKLEKKQTRKVLMDNAEFIPIFTKQKERVKNMHLKYILEEHDILQTILEPYFAYKLKTYPEYNTFETH
jgi:predicted GIY-YIG superfamily endonuclease